MFNNVWQCFYGRLKTLLHIKLMFRSFFAVITLKIYAMSNLSNINDLAGIDFGQSCISVRLPADFLEYFP